MRPYLLLLAFCGVCSAQAIEGFVEDSTTGLPVVGARIAFGGPTVSDRYMSFSDRAGHFLRVFPQAVPYNVVVSHAGYLTPAQPLTVTPGQDSSHLRIALTPQAVISGKLEDEDGFPVEGTRVEALCYEVVDGQRKLRLAGTAATSNDLGEYRIAGLTAGSYYLRAIPPNGNWDNRYVTEYYPGLLEPLDGNSIAVAVGQQLSGVVFPLKKYEGATVSGRVVLAPGTRSMPYMQVVFLRAVDGTGFSGRSVTWKDEDPAFAIRHVPPGTYFVEASSSGTPWAEPGEWIAQQQVQVSGTDVSNVVLAFHAAHTPGK
jgi:hypothetical protein